jgi:hypothetical protein
VTTAQPDDSGCDAHGQGRLPTGITHAAMNAAFDAGMAVLLSQAVNWVVHYREAWWVVYEHGWLRITDAATVQDLDKAAERLAQAEATAKNIGHASTTRPERSGSGSAVGGPRSTDWV